MKTMICVILDRSGSMQGRESDVVGGVNKFLEEQRKVDKPASIAFVRFDGEAVERFRPMGDLKACADLSAGEYSPRGSTPLLDAVGKTLADLDEDWKREAPDQAVVVIVTDGQENASREYTQAKVKGMIESRQKSGKWMFIYLGADVDAFAESHKLGIPMSNSAGYVKSAAGMASMTASMSASVGTMRITGSKVASNLGGNIGEAGDVKAFDQNATSGAAPISPARAWSEPGKAWTPPA